MCCRWFGKCWYIHELLKYEFGIEFDVSGEDTGGLGGARGWGAADPRVPLQIPVTYPATAPEIAIPELDGKTAKMYRLGGVSRGCCRPWGVRGAALGADGSPFPAGGARSA